MPATYAHYRLGVALLPTMPADVRRTIGRFRRMFDVGLHGPDLFFYLNVPFSNKTGKLGGKFHKQTGREFFQRLCRMARIEKSEAILAYAYGALCHYALDAYCHPFVIEQSQKGPASHTEIESEFDRYLLELDGKKPPESQDFSGHMRLTPGECSAVAKCYPPATSRQIQDGVRKMAKYTKLLATPEGARRAVLRKGLSLLGADVAGMLMTTGPNARCFHMNQQLLELYHRAMEAFPELLNQLQAHMTYNGLFGEEFTKIFG